MSAATDIVILFKSIHFTTKPFRPYQSCDQAEDAKAPLRCLVPGNVCISLADSWPGSWRRVAGGCCRARLTGSHLSAGSERDTGTTAAKHSPGRAGRLEPAGTEGREVGK